MKVFGGSTWSAVSAALLLWTSVCQAALPQCVRNLDCEEMLMRGSVCKAGTCTNPFYENGCLNSMLEARLSAGISSSFPKRTRVCTSEDPSEAEKLGFCQQPDPTLDYAEIRIATQNWESVFMEAWMLQILLTEVVGVPVTLETGTPDVKLDFYHPEMAFGYGAGNDWKIIENSVKINSDCRQIPSTAEDGSYVPCAHVTPEVWATQSHNLARVQQEEIIESPGGLGVVGQQGWFIPRFAAENDPTLLTYFGLSGPENRRKLADTFFRPTTWGDYCAEVSPTKCELADGVASRAPLDENEAGKYFAGENVFKGHFRRTEENDCDNHPDTCTGHIADYPCGWSSFVEQQAFHLDIGLRSSGPEPGCQGYSYGSLMQIVAAANATRSPIIVEWWKPDALPQMYRKTPMEFQSISLPPATQECMESTISPDDRCHQDQAVRVGGPEGACEEPPYPLQKAISNSLFDITVHSSIPAAQKSPAYDIIKSFSISTLELGQIFGLWLKHESDVGSPFTLRHATCEWMVDHWDEINDWIPRDFPRVTQAAEDKFEDSLYTATLSLAGITAVAVMLTALFTHIQRNRPVIRHAQVGFLWIILAGLFLVSVGNIVMLAPVANATCIVSSWLINLGYTLELVPLIVKVAAVQRMIQAAKNARRIVVDMNQLYMAVAGLSSLVIVFLLLWTVVDAPSMDSTYILSSDQTENGETIVWTRDYCNSDSDVWRYLAAVWHCFLLVAGAVLAFSTRKIKTDFNENQAVTLMIYSHSVFVLLRVVTFSLQFGEGGETDAMRYRSLIFSCDSIATVAIYFVSKFVSKDDNSDVVDLRTSTISQTLASHNMRASQRNVSIGGASTHKNGDRYGRGPRQGSMIPSIMECEVESSSDAGDSDRSSHMEEQPMSWKASTKESSKSGESNDDDDDNALQNRLTNYLSSQTTSGLRCRHCGNLVSDDAVPEQPVQDKDQ